MLAKALTQQPYQVVRTPGSYCLLQTSCSLMDVTGDQRRKNQQAAGLIETGSEAQNSSIPRMHTPITKAFNVPNIPPLHIRLPPQSITSFQ